MQMKREVLRLGGYAREYFVSQTPELTQMADVVIDLTAGEHKRSRAAFQYFDAALEKRANCGMMGYSRLLCL
jgi:hypothetical protein